MRRGTDIILPARFLLTVGHFVVTVMAFSSIDACASAGIAMDATAEQLASAKQSMSASLSLSIIAFIVQFGGLFLGLSIFNDASNLLLSVLNFFGGVLIAWGIVDQWAYPSFWALVVCFSLLPGVIEAWAISGQLLTRRTKV